MAFKQAVTPLGDRSGLPRPTTETTNPRIERALEIVGREIKRAEDERNRFDRFRRLSDPWSEDERQTRSPSIQGRLAPTDLQMVGAKDDRVVTVYRDAVMSTPHYEGDYGYSLKTEFTAEVGHELARPLTTAERISPLHCRTVQCAARHSRTERESFHSALHEERDPLETANARFSEWESRAFELRTGPREGP